MARWDYGLPIHQGPLYTAQTRSSHSLTFHDEYNFSSQCHSSAQNCSVSFCIIVLSLEIEYLHNLLPHLASCCILPSCTQTEIWNMFYTVSKVVSPFLYLGYSLCPKFQLPFQICFSTCRFCDHCLLMTHRVYCHHLHNIFWSSIFTHSVQARCEMRFFSSLPPSAAFLLSSGTLPAMYLYLSCISYPFLCNTWFFMYVPYENFSRVKLGRILLTRSQYNLLQFLTWGIFRNHWWNTWWLGSKTRWFNPVIFKLDDSRKLIFKNIICKSSVCNWDLLWLQP